MPPIMPCAGERRQSASAPALESRCALDPPSTWHSTRMAVLFDKLAAAVSASTTSTELHSGQ